MEDKIKETVTHNLKAVRKQQGLTQEDFAIKIGIKRALMGAYEEGRANPPLTVLVRISKLTGIDVHSFITEKIGEEVSNA